MEEAGIRSFCLALPSSLLTGAGLLLWHRSGVLKPQEWHGTEGGTWETALWSFAAVECIRLFVVLTLPVWWYKVAKREKELTREVHETCGVQVTSMVASLVTLSGLAMADFTFTTELPFLHMTKGSTSGGMYQHLSVFLLVYVLSDTSHLLRTWRLVPNPAMLIHHIIFTYILVAGATHPQQMEHYHIHAILFTAEISTPFLNSRWLLRNIFMYKGKALPAVCNLAFASLFTLSRMVLYAALCWDLCKMRSELNFPTAAFQDTFAVAVCASYVLNAHWFSLIVKAILKPAAPKGKGSPKAKTI
ncbi:unnamed protein product [Chrysoparadoxa australica]